MPHVPIGQRTPLEFEPTRRLLMEGIEAAQVGIVPLEAIRRRFDETVQFTREFLDRVRVKPTSVERASHEAADLLVRAGVVDSLDEGIVIFHERISRGRPGLRRILRRLDMREGRLTVARPSPAQQATREVLKAAMVTRGPDGRIKSFTRKGKVAIAKATKAQGIAKLVLARRKRLRAEERLKALGKPRR